MRELIATQSCDDLKVSTEQRRDLACRAHVTHRSPLRDRCGQVECPCDRPDAAPYWTGSSEANGAEIDHADRVILVTCEQPGYAIGIYHVADYADGGDALTIVDVDTDDPIVEVLRYLVDEQPERTDWSAWPAQRLGDDQTTLLRRLN